MLRFIKTKDGNYVKVSDITLIYTDGNNICCVAGICPKIILGLYSDRNKHDEIKEDIINKCLYPETISDGVYKMPED